LKETFVDSGVAGALEAVDHEVLYGRRGTGKTHAFAYLAATRMEAGDIGVYVDLRTIGSAEGIFGSETVMPLERTARLLVDLLEEVHDSILQAAVDDNDLIADDFFVAKLDGLMQSLQDFRLEGPVETTVETEQTSSQKASMGAAISGTGASAKAGAEASGSNRDKTVQSRGGQERRRLEFSEIAGSLRDLAEALTAIVCGCSSTSGAAFRSKFNPISEPSSSAVSPHFSRSR
jgi:hypothetical protein